MTTLPRYSLLRHRLLAEIAAGHTQVYVGLQWNLVRDGVFLQRGEIRTANSLRPLIRAPFRHGVHVAARLTSEGEALLSAWNTRWGNPLTAEEA